MTQGTAATATCAVERVANVGWGAAVAGQVFGIAGALVSTGMVIRGWSCTKSGQRIVRDQQVSLAFKCCRSSIGWPLLIDRSAPSARMTSRTWATSGAANMPTTAFMLVVAQSCFFKLARMHRSRNLRSSAVHAAAAPCDLALRHWSIRSRICRNRVHNRRQHSSWWPGKSFSCGTRHCELGEICSGHCDNHAAAVASQRCTKRLTRTHQRT